MAKVSNKNVYPDDPNISMLDYLLGTNANNSKRTNSYPVQGLADLILAYVQENVDALDQDNHFRYVRESLIIGNNKDEDLSTVEAIEAAILVAINQYLEITDLEVSEKDLIVFEFRITQYGPFTTHSRKYLFPHMLGKGIYAPMHDTFTAEMLSLIFVDNLFYQALPEDIESNVNNVVFDLGDITGENFLDYINTVPSLYPDGYPLTDNTKIYYFKWVDDDVTYMYYFDEENSLNSYGTYGVGGDFIFVITDLVLFYNSDNPVAPVPAITKTSQLINDGSDGLDTYVENTELTTALSLKADLVAGKVPSAQLPSYVDDVIEVANFASLPVTGETGKIYVTIDTNRQYRWSGSVYVIFSSGITITLKTITSANIATQDIAGLLLYVNSAASYSIAFNETVKYHVTDTGQIFELLVNGVSVGSGQPALTSSQVLIIKRGFVGIKQGDFSILTHATYFAPNKINQPIGNDVTIVGTADDSGTGPNYGGNTYVRWVRRRYASSASAGSNVSISTGSYKPVDLTSSGQFFVSLHVGNEDASAVSNGRTFFGCYSTGSSIGNVDPSTATDLFGLGNDGADANMQIMHNDSSAGSTKINLGASFPANTVSSDHYLFQFWKYSGSTTINYRVLNIHNSAEVFGSVNTNMPVSGYYFVVIQRNNNSTAAAVRLSASHIIVSENR